MKKKLLVTFILFFLLLPVLNISAAAAPQYSPEQQQNLEAFKIIPDQPAQADYSLIPDCINQEKRIFDQYQQCQAVCENCVLRDDSCWHCIDSSEDEKDKKEKPGQTSNWWQNIKNWFINLWNNIVNLFKGKQNVKPAAQPKQPVNAWQDLGEKLAEFYKARQQGTQLSEQSDQQLQDAFSEAINQAENFNQLLKARELAMYYCSEKYGVSSPETEKCQDKYNKLARQRGDELKEQALSKINENDISADTYQQMVYLWALLSAGENAAGEGEYFSTYNIRKVRQELNKKAAIYLEKSLLAADWQEIDNWFIFCLAYTKASSDDGSGLLAGISPKRMAQYRYRRLLLQKLAKMDICNPDPQELADLQQRMKTGTGCADKLGSDQACKQLAAGNLEEVYKILYNKDKNDQANKMKENQADEPVDCTKKDQQTNTQTETEQKEDDYNQENNDEQDFKDNSEQTQPETQSNDSQQSQDLPEEDPAETEQLPEEDPAETDQPPEEEPAEEFPEEYTCDMTIFENTITGWEFNISNCDRSDTEVYSCIMQCGFLPPQVISDQQEMLCYETAGGFIDYQTIVPCRFDPLPPPDLPQCVTLCLQSL